MPDEPKKPVKTTKEIASMLTESLDPKKPEVPAKPSEEPKPLPVQPTSVPPTAPSPPAQVFNYECQKCGAGICDCVALGRIELLKKLDTANKNAKVDPDIIQRSTIITQAFFDVCQVVSSLEASIINFNRVHAESLKLNEAIKGGKEYMAIEKRLKWGQDVYGFISNIKQIQTFATAKLQAIDQAKTVPKKK